MTEQMLIQKARQQGCKVYGLSDYQIIKKETHRVMLGYASLSLSGIEEGMGLLEKHGFRSLPDLELSAPDNNWSLLL